MIATGNWGNCDWTISDEGRLVISGGLAESVSADGKSPWNEYSDKIRSVSIDGTVSGVVSLIGSFMNCTQLEEVDLTGLDTSKTVDMSWLFCGCSKLRSVDLSMLDTSHVVDMSCMFLSCASLEHVEFGGINTSSVMDMSRMFMYCRNLKTVDFSGIDNSSLKMADDIFFGCDGLRAVVPGKNFSMGSSDRTLIPMPESVPAASAEADDPEAMISDWRTSRDGILYIADTDFTVRYDAGEGHVPADLSEEDAGPIVCKAGTELRVKRDLFEPPADREFLEWNTIRDGSGRRLMPGQLFHVNADMTLYAIWAGTPVFREVYDIPEITYGELLELREPLIDTRHGKDLSVQVQISDVNDSDWTDFANDTPLPVSRTGARIRYIAKNHVGTSISEEKPISIRKARFDVSGAEWILPDDLNYDGQEKQVRLEGLPEGVTAVCAGAAATNVGTYTASAILQYDEENYEQPDPIPELRWTINKGSYQMSDLNWTYMEAFTYDGEPKSVRLEGLPEGTVPYYSGADAVNAGTYFATAGLDYDIDNYDHPDAVRPCRWQILKTTHDMSNVHWEGPDAFIYDGSPKKVELSGLPEGVRAEYTGNQAVDAGVYTARAAFVLDDPVNYEIPEPVSFPWEIRKADHDVAEMRWTDDSPVYDGTPRHIALEGVPAGVSVLYEGDTATEAGEYTVRAEFCVDDLNNYNQMDPISKSWRILKADIDTSGMRWNYSSPYVYNGACKSVALRDVPEEILQINYTGEQAVNAGTYTAHAEAVYDELNYNPPQIPDCRWTILKANLKLQNLGWDYESPFTYDGRPHQVSVTGLPDNARVEYEEPSAVAAGTHVTRALITPADPDNYNTPEPAELSWDIRKAVFDISGFHWTTDQKRVFDGGMKSVGISGLPAGVHVSYEGNEAADAGTYRARAVFTVDDTDNFEAPEPEEVTWEVASSGIDLSGIRWDYSAPFVYDGSEKEVLLEGLPAGVEARYTGNVASEAGEYRAEAVLTAPEDGNFHDTKILGKFWKIDKADIDVSDARWICPGDFVYDGMEKQVFLAGLPDSVRVAYSGAAAVDAGTYRAEAVLTPYDEDNFNPPQMAGFTWQIARADIDVSGVSWSGCETFVYDGTTHRVILKDVPDMLEVVYDGNAAVNAGHYIAGAQFIPKDEKNYNAPARCQYEWSVGKAQIRTDSIYWLPSDELVYNGEEHSVRLAGVPDGVNVSYRGNTAVDAGQYIASAVLEPEDEINFLPGALEPYRWEIEKAEIDVSDVMWASSGELVYDGTLKVVGLTGLPDDISVEYENNVATDAGTYHASAVLSTESRNYVAPEIEGCTWTITKAVPDISGISWSYAFEFTYDGYEKRVELMDLPEGMSAVYEGNTGIEAGDYTATARLVMRDAMNYEPPLIAPLEWKIGKREYDMTTVSWTGAEGFVYDGTEKRVELMGLEEGLEPVYEGNTAVDAGQYTATATFLYDEHNYYPPEAVSCQWEIRKAPLDTSGVRWTYDGPMKAGRNRTVTLQTEGDQPGLFGKMFGGGKEPKYLGLPEGTTVRYEGNTARTAGVYEARAYLTVPPQPNHEVSGPIVLTWELTDD